MDRRLSSSSDSGFKDGTEYNPSRVRITRPTPPKPATNPLQFVKIGPCDLYRSAQEQLKKVEVIKQLKSEKFKDEAEDWQSNLDSWKSTRRKRQERIIERVVEIKNMEQETDKGRRRSKTFSEMLEERNSRRPKLLSMYTEDDNNDLSDLGLSTPSRKGSFSGDSLIDDIQSNRDSDEQTNSLEHQNTEKESNNINDSNKQKNNNSINEKSPDKIEEYTYESAIQGYKTRVERKNYYETSNGIATQEEKEKTNEKRPSLYSLRNLSSSTNEISSFSKVDMPKVDISKRKQLFESESISEKQPINKEKLPEELSQSKSIKERLIHLQKCTEESVKIKNAAKRLSGDIMTVRERLSSLVMQTSDDSTTRNNMTTWASAGQLSNATLSEPRHKHEDQNKNITESLKESLLRLNNTSNKPEIDEEMTSRSFSPIYDKGRTFHSSLDNLNMRESTTEHCNLEHVQSLDALDYCGRNNYAPSGSSTELLALSQCGDTDREDSGIQTADVSCSVSQADEPEEDPEIISALNPARVERQLLAATVNLNSQKTNPPPIKTYLSTIEILNPSCAEDISIKSEPTDKSQQSEDSIVTEELITCTIKPDIKTKPLFEEETLPVENIIGISNPLAPARSMEPPKEKPPPPPVDNSSDDDESLRTDIEPELRRLNSTKRLKNEMRNKRSSFLGIEGLQNDYLEQELNVSKPPDANTILQEELQLEKQLYRRSQSYQHFDSSPSTDLESRDSGVELESRADNMLDSDKAGMSDYDITENNKLPKLFEEDEVTKKEREIIENLIKEEQCNHNFSYCNDKSVPNVNSKNNNQLNTNDNKEHRLPINYQHQDDEHIEDVLKVERELLQLEREELERQRDDMLYQNSKGMKLVNKAGMSLEDISTSQYLSNCVRQYEIYSNYQEITPHPQYNASQMSKHTLHALSATPRSRLMNTDAWIQPQARKTSLTSTSHDRDNYNQHWLIQEAEQRRLSEQKSPIRNSNTRLSAPVHEKHIPDTVVQTLTQRLQNRPTVRERSNVLNRNEGDRNGHRVPMGPVYDPLRGRGIVAPPPVINSHVPPPAASINPVPPMYDPHEKMLSVSGKKKCSHCGEELGRGAAMIIESLCLFYHMDCFKCCVCHVQLGDGRMGTDVRVRNHKLHCHNCYSSEDGVKFSCV